jgi:hypothetical protein
MGLSYACPTISRQAAIPGSMTLELAHAGLGAQIEHGSGWKFSISDEPANYEPLGVESNKI